MATQMNNINNETGYLGDLASVRSNIPSEHDEIKLGETPTMPNKMFCFKQNDSIQNINAAEVDLEECDDVYPE